MPTEFNDLPQASPAAGVQLIQAPSVNNMGDANLSFPIEVPPGRQGIQPSLNISYNSSGSNGWLGLGWNLSIPSIEIETRWGVPRFDKDYESEVYLLNGEQLVAYEAVDMTSSFYLPHRVPIDLVDDTEEDWEDHPRTVDRQFYPRRQYGNFQRIIRRQHMNPDPELFDDTEFYYWEITDASGVKYIYGSDNEMTQNDFVIRNEQGDVVRWCISKVIDPYGNMMTYEYTREFYLIEGMDCETGICGENIYPSNIKYTYPDIESKPVYEVHFTVSDKASVLNAGLDLSFGARTSAIISDAHLLTEVSVQYGTELIRKYEFVYKRGEFKKTLLERIQVYDSDGMPFYDHAFMYESLNQNNLYEVETWNLQDDQIAFTFPGLFGVLKNGQADFENISGIGGSNSSGWGISGYIGAGIGNKNITNKRKTIGARYSFNRSNDKGRIQLIDINGDHLPDKVIMVNDKVYARLNLSRRGQGITNASIKDFSDPPIELFEYGTSTNIGAFSETVTNRHTFGIEVNLTGVTPSANKSWTTSKTRVYFSDVNGDGLVDIVDNGTVWFNVLDGNGNPSFTQDSKLTDCPILQGPCSESNQDQLLREDAEMSPLGDVIKVWEAPFDGEINISGVAMYSGNGDGVILSTEIDPMLPDPLNIGVQLALDNFMTNYVELLNSGDNADMSISNLPILRGQRIFFRVRSGIDDPGGSYGNGEDDEVIWNPVIEYNNMIDPGIIPGDDDYDPINEDVQNQDVMMYDFNADYIESYSVTNVVQIPQGFTDYKLALNGSIELPMGGLSLSDEVKVEILIARNKIIGGIDAEMIPIILNSGMNVIVDPGDVINLNQFNNIDIMDGVFGFETLNSVEVSIKVFAKSNVDWQRIVLNSPMIELSYDDGGIVTQTTEANVEFEYYIEDSQKGAFSYVTLPANESSLNCIVNFDVMVDADDFPENDPHDICVTIKTYNSGNDNFEFLSSGTGSIVRIGAIFSFTMDPINLSSSNEDRIAYVTFNMRDEFWSIPISNVEFQFGANAPVPGSLWTPGRQKKYKFGNYHRGWGIFAYNPKDETITTGIDISSFSFEDDVESDADDGDDKVEYFENTIGGIYDIRFHPLNPKNEAGILTFKLGENIILDGNGVIKPSRIGETVIGGAPCDGMSDTYKATILEVRSRDALQSVGLSFDPLDISSSNHIGNNFGTHTIEYFDLNGDRHPEIISRSSVKVGQTGNYPEIEFTDGVGIRQPVFDGPTNFESRTDNEWNAPSISVGGTFGFGETQDDGSSSANEANDKGSISISGEITNPVESSFYKDINGDGLVDMVKGQFNGNYRYYLNLGYSFSNVAISYFPNTSVFRSERINTGIGLAFSKANGSWRVGVGGSYGEQKILTGLLDVNGDGLLDIVDPKSNKLDLNVGAGFFEDEPFVFPANSRISKTKNYGGNLNATGTLGLIIPVPACPKVSFSLGANLSIGKSSTSKSFMDVNGDGYVDYLKAESMNLLDNDDDLDVNLSTIGTTNYLTKVTGPFGHEVNIEYGLTAANSDHPGGKWVMSAVQLDDGLPGDGIDYSRQEFDYVGGKYDRCEREFLGFTKVIVDDVIMDGMGNPIGPYRRKIMRFDTTYYGKGMLISDSLGTPDLAERFFIEDLFVVNENDINFRNITPNSGANAYSIASINDDNGDNVFGELEASVFVAVDTTTSRIYEGDNTENYVASQSLMYYDHYGRLTSYQYTNDGVEFTPNQDNARYTVVLAYHTENDNNIFSLPTSHEVFEGDGSGNLLRKTTAMVIDDLAKYSQITVHGTPNSITNYAYNENNGNLITVHLPETNPGERPSYNYTYEDDLGIYITEISDHFGYTSKNLLWDYKFGVSGLREDINKNHSYSCYDTKGRLTKIIGPKELPESYDPDTYIACDATDYTIKYDYHNLTYKYATTERFDPLVDQNTLSSRTHIDGLGRIVQTVGDACIWNGSSCEEKTVKSGRIEYDFVGRPVVSFFPTVGIDDEDYSRDIPASTELQSNIVYNILDRPVNETNMGVASTYDYGFEFDKHDIPVRRHMTLHTLLGGDGGTKETYVFNKAGGIKTSVSSELVVDNASQGDVVTNFYYDGIEQLLQIENANEQFTTYTYDLQGRLLSKDLPDCIIENYTYNPLGLIKQRKRGASQITDYIYNFNHLIGIDYEETGSNDFYDVEYIYGDNAAPNNQIGRLIESNDATGKHEFWYGNLGEVIEERRTIPIPHITDAATFVTKYSYDTWNRIESMVYPDDELVTYSYDVGGNLRSVQGTKGAYTYNYVNDIGYNKFGQVVYRSIGDPNTGVTTEYTYESNTRWLSTLVSKHYNDQNALVNFQDITYGFDGIGNITSMTDVGAIPTGNEALGGGSTYGFFYDNHSRLETASGVFTGPTRLDQDNNQIVETSDYDMALEYDFIGNILKKDLTQRRTDLDYPTTLTKEYSMDYFYDEENDDIFPNHIDNILESYQDFEGPNLQNDPDGIDHIVNHQYDLDEFGNPLLIDKLVDDQAMEVEDDYNVKRNMLWDYENRLLAVNDDGQVSHYFYDGGGQRVLKLLQQRAEIWTNGALSGAYFEPMEYTMYVNPYLVVRNNKQYTKHIYINSERVATKIGDNPSYNVVFDDGETLQDPSKIAEEFNNSLGWNISNKQFALEEALVDNYGAFGIEIGHLEGNLPSDFEEIIFANGDGDDNDCDIPEYECLLYFFNKNHLGSSSYISDQYGQLLQHIEYSASGETFVDQRRTEFATPYRFTGKEQDCETGLYYFGARYYDPSIGRFLSVDPLADASKNIGYSPYSYAINNPITYIDPDGRCWQKVGEEYVPCDNGDVGSTTTGAFGNSWTMTESSGWQLTGGSDPSTVEAYYTEQTPDGSAAYYENRYTEHIEKYNTRPPDYYLGYGHKYNVRFNNKTRAGLSEAGKGWLDQTSVELQVLMEGALRDNPSIELNNGTFQKFAFESHVPAYSKGNLLFQLGPIDQVKIGWTPDFKDSFSRLGLSQGFKIIDMQYLYNAFRASPSSMYGKTKNPNYLRMGGL